MMLTVYFHNNYDNKLTVGTEGHLLIIHFLCLTNHLKRINYVQAKAVYLGMLSLLDRLFY